MSTERGRGGWGALRTRRWTGRQARPRRYRAAGDGGWPGEWAGDRRIRLRRMRRVSPRPSRSPPRPSGPSSCRLAQPCPIPVRAGTMGLGSLTDPCRCPAVRVSRTCPLGSRQRSRPSRSGSAAPLLLHGPGTVLGRVSRRPLPSAGPQRRMTRMNGPTGGGGGMRSGRGGCCQRTKGVRMGRAGSRTRPGHAQRQQPQRRYARTGSMDRRSSKRVSPTGECITLIGSHAACG